MTWSDFEIEGQLQDPPDTVRTLFTPVMTRRTSLTEDARADVVATATRFGYFVVGLGTREAPNGTHAVLHLAPLPLVRKVDIDVKQSPFATLLDDQIRRADEHISETVVIGFVGLRNLVHARIHPGPETARPGQWVTHRELQG